MQIQIIKTKRNDENVVQIISDVPGQLVITGPGYAEYLPLSTVHVVSINRYITANDIKMTFVEDTKNSPLL